MVSSKNALNTTPKKMGHLNITILFNVLIIVMILVYDFPVVSRRELGRPIFLEDIFGLAYVFCGHFLYEIEE
jgi:hypothetical protein